ncbi:MAG TPA: superoxide dismutase [Alphaproteobacteria bacterium]|nr:superoxide dismutase [Alphaproteobacteria bacterium]
MSETMSEAKAAFSLPKLPYEENALEPLVSARTLSFHYGKHHAGYVAALNRLVEGSAYQELELAEVVRRTAQDPTAKAVFNNAAQAWNHQFYWQSMAPRGGGEPDDKLRRAIERDFGTVKALRAAFAKAALGQFGSGWTWLVADPNGKLGLLATANADTPITRGETPLVAIDLWEHAYYLDYQNRRADYVTAWIDRLINWRFAERNFG